jgi:hypothetical protein
MDVVRKDKKSGKRYVLREEPVGPGELGTAHLFDSTAPRTKLVAEKPPPNPKPRKKRIKKSESNKGSQKTIEDVISEEEKLGRTIDR